VPGEQVGVDSGWRPVDQPAVRGLFEVKRCGVFQIAEIRCRRSNGQFGGTFGGANDGRFDRDQRAFVFEVAIGAAEGAERVGLLSSGSQQRMKGIEVAAGPRIGSLFGGRARGAFRCLGHGVFGAT